MTFASKAFVGLAVIAATIPGTAAAASQPQPAAAHAKYCVSNNHGAYACFQPYGDKVTIKDTKKDGLSAGVVYQVDGYRYTCVNSQGKGTTMTCGRKNFPEGHKITFWSVNYNRPTSQWKNWSAGRTTTT